jgi:quercetin dioxygenase-like cupin family protein
MREDLIARGIEDVKHRAANPLSDSSSAVSCEALAGLPPWAVRVSNMFLKNVSGRAEFKPDKMGKSTLAQGDFLFAGLNSFEPGQEHAPHAHEAQDKLYVVLEGAGLVRIGEDAETLSAGDAAFAPAGIVHSIHNSGARRLVVMAVLSPPPSSR